MKSVVLQPTINRAQGHGGEGGGFFRSDKLIIALADRTEREPAFPCPACRKRTPAFNRDFRCAVCRSRFHRCRGRGWRLPQNPDLNRTTGAEPGATASIVATLDCWSYNAAAKARRFSMLLFAAEIRTENRPRACESN